MKRSLSRFLNHFYLENAAGYFAATTALITSYSLLINPSFGILTPSILEEGKWWNVALYAFRFFSPSEMTGNTFWTWFSLGIHAYILFVVGRIMEESLGSPRFNLYLWSAVLHITVGGVLSVYFPLFVDTRLIYQCILIGIAILMPNAELFILPIKMKWIGVVVFVYSVVICFDRVHQVGSNLPLLGLYFGYSNLILFFGKDFVSSFRRKARATAWSTQQNEIFTIHKCHICGATELSNPLYEFRYCVNCEDQEYCEKHLHDHAHVLKGKA